MCTFKEVINIEGIDLKRDNNMKSPYNNYLVLNGTNIITSVEKMLSFIETYGDTKS